ncbi:hypothetical protein Cgig2_026404 [Carnegiea gigantea]|uniref:Uncharacterized protein n=1 Tax=Carnegiea gigantea TaxID=171969 RepID=A0A9Q1QAU0_9CARY|nr:hypothetical protein Cgig2_026404 [Carnegiea gigantea]
MERSNISVRVVLFEKSDGFLGVKSYEQIVKADCMMVVLVAGNGVYVVLYKLQCQVDPIVASFSGGAVGVISALMVVEINNVKQQEQKRCQYCLGTGYLACARCCSTGSRVLIEPVSTVNGGDQPLLPPKTERCPNCSGSGKIDSAQNSGVAAQVLDF